MSESVQQLNLFVPSVDSSGSPVEPVYRKGMPRIGILILEDWYHRRGRVRASFESRKNLGILIVRDVIQRTYQIPVGFASMATINEFDWILVTLTSVFDVYNLIDTFEKYDVGEIRPKIVIGGAALLNIRTFLEYGDFFVFGRGEKPILDIMEWALNKVPIQNESIFIKGENDFNQTFKLAQSDSPYPYEVSGLRESMLGCPKKCFYCGYTYHRKPQTGILHYYWVDDAFWRASEMTIREVVREIKDSTRVITSIDGSSARLRRVFNKAMDDDELRSVFMQIPKVPSGFVFLKVFNICGYPTETDSERYEPFSVLLPVSDKLKNHTTVLYQMTPFTPYPLTPAQYLPADVMTNYQAWYHRIVRSDRNRFVYDVDNLRVGYSSSIFTNMGLLKHCLILRGLERDTSLLRNIIFDNAFNKKPAEVQAKTVLNRPDMDRLYRQYEIGEPMPFDYLHSYFPKKSMDNLACRLHSELGV